MCERDELLSGAAGLVSPLLLDAPGENALASPPTEWFEVKRMRGSAS